MFQMSIHKLNKRERGNDVTAAGCFTEEGDDKLNWECGDCRLPQAYFFVIIISDTNFISVHLGRRIRRYPSVFNRPIMSYSNWNLRSLHPISAQTSTFNHRRAGNEREVDTRSDLWSLAAEHHRERETDLTKEEFYSVTYLRLMERYRSVTDQRAIRLNFGSVTPRFELASSSLRRVSTRHSVSSELCVTPLSDAQRNICRPEVWTCRWWTNENTPSAFRNLLDWRPWRVSETKRGSWATVSHQ